MAALPSSNISVTMVKQAIGSGSNDVGTLCTHPNINKWSKWKPVSFNKPSGITLTELQSIKFGMVLITSNTPSNLLSAINNNGYDVKYQKPTGGASSPYRLGDFRNYHHDSVIPLGTSIAQGVVNKVKKGSAYYKNLDYYMDYQGIELTEDDYNITKVDLYGNSVYRGIMLTNGTMAYWKTGRVNWNDSFIKGWLGNTQAFQFYTTKEQLTLRDGNQADSGAIFYAMCTDNNNSNPYSLNVTNEYGDGTLPYVLLINASKSGNIVSYSVTFDATVPEAAGAALTNIYISLYEGDTEINTKSEGNYTLMDGTSKTYTGTFTTTSQGLLKIKVFENLQLQGEKTVIVEQ